jgi:hypothetical protein
MSYWFMPLSFKHSPYIFTIRTIDRPDRCGTCLVQVAGQAGDIGRIVPAKMRRRRHPGHNARSTIPLFHKTISQRL